VPEPAESLAALSIGERDARLAAIYECLFGDTLHAFAECPQCAERLEYSMSTNDLEFTSNQHRGAEGLTVAWGATSLRLRLPNSLDLRAIQGCGSLADARSMLAQRCVVPEHDGAALSRELPDAAIERIAERLSAADPHAERLINLTCAGCAHHWQVLLDIEGFLWVKIAWLAKRLLREVHVLARSYGWREADILGMTTVRRRFYLELAGA
jgi:hypothetical protein